MSVKITLENEHYDSVCVPTIDMKAKAIREKKEVALKAYCKRCQDMGGGYPCSHKCYEYLEFEKTLEE